MTGNHTVLAQFTLSRQALELTLDELTDEAWDMGLAGSEGPSPRFILAHALANRAEALVVLGNTPNNPYEEYLGPDARVAETASPSILIPDWGQVADAFERVVSEVDTNEPLGAESPSGGSSVGAWLSFWAWHEAYHVGQLASLRRVLGLRPLRDRLATAGPEVADQAAGG